MKRAEFESQLAALQKRYSATTEPREIKLLANTIIGLYDTYLKSLRFALAQAYKQLEEKK